MMNPSQRTFHLGLELAGNRIQAGVFDGTGRLCGKASRSAKTERGEAEVIQRLARRGLDAVDDADLIATQITAAGILTGVPAAPRADARIPSVGGIWNAGVMNQLAGYFPPPLGSRLVAGSLQATLLWAIHEQELAGAPRRMLGLFAGADTDFFYADRSQPGEVRVIPGRTPGGIRTGVTDESALGPVDPQRLVAAVRETQADLLLLVGDSFEDGNSVAARRIRDVLAEAGLRLPVHIPVASGHAGIWAAARLAARTFPG